MEQENLEQILKETSEEHHKAFIETNGEDPEWYVWYAKYLMSHKEAQSILFSYTEETLIEKLKSLGNYIESDWATHYSKELLA